jgi:hypothetical protein
MLDKLLNTKYEYNPLNDSNTSKGHIHTDDIHENQLFVCVGAENA